MRKVLSVFLALALIFTFTVTATTAAETPVGITVEGASVSAQVDKLNGNQNKLWITVTDNSGSKTESYMIANNATGMYPIETDEGYYTVYVDTKGNTQIRACYIVAFYEFCDTVIKNGDVRTMDNGKTAEAVGIKDGKIIFVGSNKLAEMHTGPDTAVIDAKGAVVSPGFIDLHQHSDGYITGSSGRYRSAETYIRQGVTTSLNGNCGGSTGATVAAHFNSVQSSRGVGFNYATLVGYSTLRSRAGVPSSQIEPNPTQLEAMKASMAQAMRDGAFGVSTGLEYAYTGCETTAEVIEVSKVAAQYGGFYASHIRDERIFVVEAVEEAIEIGRQAGLPVHISHLKTDSSASWGKADDVIARIKSARESGLDVTADMYPYMAWVTSFSWMIGDYTRTQLRNAISSGNTEVLDAIKANIRNEMVMFFDSDGSLIQIPSYRDAVGNVYIAHTLSEILAARGVEDTVENIVDLTVEILNVSNPWMIGFGMTEENVIKNMQQDFVSIASDAEVWYYSDGEHPRAYGTYPQVLGEYVREKGVISLDEALRKMTVLPAERMNLTDRGMIKNGYWADITIFDPNTIKDNSDYAVALPPSGINYVWVNGVLVVDDGLFIADQLSVLPGQILYGPGYIAE